MNTIEAKDIKSQKDRVFYNNIRQTIDHLQNFIVNEAPACTSKEKITDSRSAYKLCKNEETMAVYLKDEMWIADIRVNGKRYRKKFREESGRLRFLDNEEVNRLLKNTPEQIRPIIIIALYTGLRRGELFNLEWKDIDLKRKVLNVIKSKSGKVREIPMNEFAYNTFLKLKTADNCGKIFNTVNFRKLFAQAVKGAKLNDVIMYTTRHTFASQLVMAGVDLVTVKELLGHSKIEMTMKYAHLSQNHKRQAVEQLASRINISNEEK